MKNVKSTLFIFASIVTMVTSLSIAAVPNFELYNKANKAIGMVLGSQQYIVQSMQQLPLTTNTSSTIYVEVYPDTNSTAELKMKMAEFNPHKFRIDAAGKTVYLSWNPSKSPSLYPQTGPLMGLMGKTESGYSLSNNITSSAIKKQ